MTERCGLYYCVPTLFTAKTLIQNVIKLNQKLGSEHYYSITKQRALRSDTSQALNEMFILKHRITTAYISTSCNKTITLVGSS
jgi:alkyl hydroperoxide reductase subunit AhpF